MKIDQKSELLAISDNYQSDTRRFIRFLEGRGLGLDHQGLQAYAEFLRSSGLAASTINKRLAGAKNRLRLLFSRTSESLDLLERYKIDTALKEISGLKINSRGVDPAKVLSIEEVKRLLASGISPAVKLFIEFLVNTGARVSEMTGILLAHVVDNHDYVSIRLLGKGSKERIVKVFPELIVRIREAFGGKTYLFETKKGNRFRRQYISSMIAGAGRRILKRRISAHTLRHTFATIQIRRTHKVKAVSLYLGHASTAITQDMYVHEDLELEELRLGL